jgi:hypothetical protein
MTYEQWKRRPVYIVQVYTASIGMTLPGWYELRVIGKYKRDLPTARCVRGQTAEIVRQYRREGLTRRDVRKLAFERMNNTTGCAIRVDIDTELAAMRKERN